MNSDIDELKEIEIRMDFAKNDGFGWTQRYNDTNMRQTQAATRILAVVEKDRIVLKNS